MRLMLFILNLKLTLINYLIKIALCKNAGCFCFYETEVVLMAKNDYHVIVYQILAYLYQRLKNGKDVDTAMLSYDSPLFEKINKRYWAYVIYNIYDMGYVRGITFADLDWYDVPFAVDMSQCMITPEGIEYLSDNSFTQKVIGF